MKKLLNTLYVLSENAYLSMDGEAVKIETNDIKKTVPIHTLEAIVCFSYRGASTALIGKCASNNIALSFYTPRGRYLGSVFSLETGNIMVRHEQLKMFEDRGVSLAIAKSSIACKLYNSRHILLRLIRDHPMQINMEKVQSAAENIQKYINDIANVSDLEQLRGIEGNAAAEYFGVFNELILNNKKDFTFNGRNKRPPLDNINALLSFAYTLLANDYASALRASGLDPFVGFMHSERSGRASLALDMMEETRSVTADQFVLNLINNKIISAKDFQIMESGAVCLKDSARKIFLTEWQNHKKEEITHPFLKEKIPWGLVPYVQGLLLSRYIRGDIDGYPPFFWR